MSFIDNNLRLAVKFDLKNIENLSTDRRGDIARPYQVGFLESHIQAMVNYVASNDPELARHLVARMCGWTSEAILSGKGVDPVR